MGYDLCFGVFVDISQKFRTECLRGLGLLAPAAGPEMELKLRLRVLEDLGPAVFHRSRGSIPIH